MTSKLAMIEKRTDISKLIVHLTRDDTNTFGPAGHPAEENFLTILDDMEVKAYRAHSLYAAKVPQANIAQFLVSCYTETPLQQLHRIARPIAGRQIQMEPWGLAFNREFMFERGAHQVFYVNSYPAEDPVREGFDAIFETARLCNFKGKKWNVLPFVSAIQQGYDFGWEREVRIRGSLSFDYEDVVCAIVPEDASLEVRQKLARLSIPFYTPGWSLERFVIESRKQLRRVHRLASLPKPKVSAKSG